MNKEFVPNEQALALKELGFDEPCFGEYRQWDGNEPYLQLYQDLSECSTDPADYEYTTECKAPTFSQAFRWFREKHGLYGIPEERTLNNFSYQVKSNKEGAITFIVYGGYPLNFNTYEEAELACLINLIEIVKQKQ